MPLPVEFGLAILHKEAVELPTFNSEVSMQSMTVRVLVRVQVNVQNRW